MRFGSVCSGIEAASVAWTPLGWEAAWLSEIEPFPCALLSHHYPTVPNHGDMTTLPARILSGEVEAPDVFCGGTPCQAFSVAGNRQSLDDARGNLSLIFCEIANAIDTVRTTSGAKPCIVFYENVPGILNTKDNAFGCLLGELSGNDSALQPPGGRWANAGVVHGPKRRLAWRVLDAKYFGVAQRRRRVFIVSSAREGFNPLEVLFEQKGEGRDSLSSPPKEPVTPPTTGEGTTGFRMLAFGEYTGDETASAMKARGYKDATDLVVSPVYNIIADVTPKVTTDIAGTLRADGGGGIVPPSVAYAIQGSGSTSQSSNGLGINEEVCFTLNATDVHAVSVTAYSIRPDVTPKFYEEIAGTLGATDYKDPTCVSVSPEYVVRRLLPTECEALMGFPRNYTRVPFNKKPEPTDGVRYKALGNSWAVPVVAWIGDRINNFLERQHGNT